MTTRQGLPREVRRFARELAARPRVLGVFWGQGRSSGKWDKQHALCVHVYRKWNVPKQEAIPPRIHGVATDVLAVGAVAHHSILDTADRAIAMSGADRRRSAISVIATARDGTVVALLSGHGTLRSAGAGFEPGPWPPDRAPWIQLVDDHTTGHLVELLDGAVAAKLDFAIGRLPAVARSDVLLGHQLQLLPIKVRQTPLRAGTRVMHHSPERGRIIGGELVQRAASDGLNDGEGLEIHGALVVRPASGERAFSVQGDSGSLVFDEERRAIGFVVAGAEDGSVSYLLPVNRSLQQRLAQHFPRFFEVK